MRFNVFHMLLYASRVPLHVFYSRVSMCPCGFHMCLIWFAMFCTCFPYVLYGGHMLLYGFRMNTGRNL